MEEASFVVVLPSFLLLVTRRLRPSSNSIPSFEKKCADTTKRPSDYAEDKKRGIWP